MTCILRLAQSFSSQLKWLKIETVIYSLIQVRLTFLTFSSLHVTQTTYHNERWLFSGFVFRRIAINGQV